MNLGGEQSKLEYAKDRDGFVALLEEYSEKLSTICQKIEVSGDQYVSKIAFKVISILITYASYSYIYYYGMPKGINYDFSHGTLIVTILMTLFMTIVIFGIVRDIQSYVRHRKSLVRDAASIHKKLEVIIQIVSQMQEHSEENRFSRMKMDLRLADAESIIENYWGLVRRKPDYILEAFKLIVLGCVGLFSSFR